MHISCHATVQKAQEAANNYFLNYRPWSAMMHQKERVEETFHSFLKYAKKSNTFDIAIKEVNGVIIVDQKEEP